MKLSRFSKDGRSFWGRLTEAGLVLELHPEADLKGQEADGPEHPLDELKRLPPVAGGRIFGIGRNYSAHVKELNPGWEQDTPLVFMKPDTSLVAHGEPIPLPGHIGRVDYEGELAVVLASGGRHLSQQEASQAILGYSCANDLSARDLQKSDGQWIRAKGFDAFCPLGPWIVCGPDPTNLRIRTWLNGDCVQDDSTASMSRSVEELIMFLSSFCSLRAGDVILTGTPAGVGALSPGDTVAVEIEEIGRLENTVIAAEDA